MKIGVVGGGALGMLHAAKLAAAGHEVKVWTRTAGQAGILRAEGIRLEEDDSVQTVRVDSAETGGAKDDEEERRAEAILLTVKQPAVGPALYQALERLAGPEIPVVCLQNGIGHMEKLRAALPALPLAAGVTTSGALRTSEAGVKHTGQGQLASEPAARGDGGDSTAANRAQKMLIGALCDAGMTASLSNEITIAIHRKLGVNAVINPLTALLGVSNGELAAAERRTLLEALCREASDILAAAGTPQEELLGDVLHVCEATADNVSSMLADVRAGRATEIEWINGGLVLLAEKAGVPAPLNRAVVTLVRAMSPREPSPKER